MHSPLCLISLKNFLFSRRGNVSIIFALAIIPTLFAMGVAVDYSMAAKRRARMNAAADAAALSAVTPDMMAQTTSAAQTRAQNIFNSQVSGLAGVGYASDVQVTVTEAPVNNLRRRTVAVKYAATSTNAFAGILHFDSLSIGGSSTASATAAANIDFYLMIDTSPSMAIAATQNDINTMLANTKAQDSPSGCAFACHEADPKNESPALGNPKDKYGNPIDNYQLARNLNVTLRLDLVQQAIGSLISTAQSDAIRFNAKYRLSGYSFDLSASNVFPLTGVNLLNAASIPSNFQMLQVWTNNVLCSTKACTAKGANNSDEDTDIYKAFQTLDAAMPAPGNGSNAPGDTPQEVLFIVTDAVADIGTGGSRSYPPMGQALPNGTTWCDSIKGRGIRIAVLYTTYLPLPTDNWYVTQVKPVQDPNNTGQDAYRAAAMACASPSLFAEVQTGGDISAALVTLFRTAITSAHLTQ